MSELNFLDALKNELAKAKVFDALTNEKTVKMMESLPGYVSEFVGYCNTQMVVLDQDEDFDKAAKLLGSYQQRLDRLAHVYVSYLPLYNNVTNLKSMASAHLQINHKDNLKILSNAELRNAAIAFILSDFDNVLTPLEEMYDIIGQCRTLLDKATLNIRLQLQLKEYKSTRHFGSKHIAGA